MKSEKHATPPAPRHECISNVRFCKQNKKGSDHFSLVTNMNVHVQRYYNRKPAGAKQ